eukprot:EG_transcript_6886
MLVPREKTNEPVRQANDSLEPALATAADPGWLAKLRLLAEVCGLDLPGLVDLPDPPITSTAIAVSASLTAEGALPTALPQETVAVTVSACGGAVDPERRVAG